MCSVSPTSLADRGKLQSANLQQNRGRHHTEVGRLVLGSSSLRTRDRVGLHLQGCVR